EALAVERSHPEPSEALEEINNRFRSAADQAAAVHHDREWHGALIRQCRLPRTAAILDILRTAAARYEYRFFGGHHSVATSARQHQQILTALRRKQHKQAAVLLKQNWEQGLKWVEQNLDK